MPDRKTKVSPWVIRRNFPFHLFLFDLLGTRLSTCTATVSTTNLLWSTNNCLQSFISNGNGNLAWPGRTFPSNWSTQCHKPCLDFHKFKKISYFPTPRDYKTIIPGPHCNQIYLQLTCVSLIYRTLFFWRHNIPGFSNNNDFRTI